MPASSCFAAGIIPLEEYAKMAPDRDILVRIPRSEDNREQHLSIRA